jgi:hypothetical protein
VTTNNKETAMQSALRPYATAGVAIVGASVTAVTPVAAPLHGAAPGDGGNGGSGGDPGDGGTGTPDGSPGTGGSPGADGQPGT